MRTSLVTPLNVNVFFLSVSILQHLFIHRMNHFLFLVIPVHANQLDSGVLLWFILPYSVVIPPRSGIFRYHSCLFRVTPMSFGFIPESFRLVPAIFRFIPVYAALFVCHSASFRYIPVPFLFIPSHSGVIPPHSGIFRFIPVYSVPFCSVPVFSNALSKLAFVFKERKRQFLISLLSMTSVHHFSHCIEEAAQHRNSCSEGP